jgi:hypothetical protein
MVSKRSKESSFPILRLDDDFIPYVEPGVYTMSYVYHETRNFFRNHPKAVFWFRIVDMGANFGVVLPRYYNVKRLVGKKKGKGGLFVPGRSSDFIREYCQLFPDRIKRLDRIPLSLFSGILVRAKVRTVERDRKQSRLADILRYSVIDEIVGIGDV